MFRKQGEEEGLARLISWAVRDRAGALKDEIARPWRRGEDLPEAEVGRWIGLGLAVGALLTGAGLAILATLSDD
ncbi:MAG: hypothetical protein KJO06_00185 [Gemmatimonadetes bacterium]|nr:hypothetical protein [Gemmatimonadota bacterium]NNK48816.1 hypothetical protein [Gemmatimonadota bacterium]